jgi:ADP-ribose pyrophosphatase
MPEDVSWNTINTAVSYTSHKFDIRVDRSELPTGETVKFEYVDEPTGVMILPITETGEVVLVREWRQTIGRVDLSLPAGLVDPDDNSPEAAAKRELLEETGYVPTSIERMNSVEPNNGLSNGIQHQFLATGCTQTGTTVRDDMEFIRTERVDIDRALRLVQQGEITDGKAISCLLFYDRFWK